MPVEFDLSRVNAELAGTRFYGRIQHFASVGSTNQLALEAAASGARTGVWVADEQTAGRGRGGHDWHSAAGDGLYVSALVAPRLSMSQAATIPLATGLAAQAAVYEMTGLKPDIRWPNDLMFQTRKCGGILVESVSEPTQLGVVSPPLRYAVIGIGINLNHAGFPPELRAAATSLYLESGRTVEREPLLAALLTRLDSELNDLEKSRAVILARFAAASTWVSGKRVKVDEQGGYTGTTRGLDHHGFLQVLGDDGVVRTVLSGGVRPA
jgi:BirA family transcriptional regulator, biotin operon repressor / biotin---[acetyl-CoA-carboxylase] ligase